MKCYVHHDVDAVGVCSECGQGVCDACAVRIGGKLYCKADADRVFSSQKEAVAIAPSPMRTQVASIVFFLYGAFGIIVGLLFTLTGFASGIAGSIPFYGSLVLTSLGLLGFGGLLLLMGIFGLICGVWLWRVQIWGAAIGIPLLAIGMIITAFFVLVGPSLFAFELMMTVWVVNFLLVVVLVFSWGTLRAFGADIVDV